MAASLAAAGAGSSGTPPDEVFVECPTCESWTSVFAGKSYPRFTVNH